MPKSKGTSKNVKLAQITKIKRHIRLASGSILPHASCTSIIVPIEEKSRSPGPALYGPSNISLVKLSSPQYSIGSKVKARISDIPGPNVYDRSNYKPGKAAPSYSFGTRCFNRSIPLIIQDYIKHRIK